MSARERGAGGSGSGERGGVYRSLVERSSPGAGDGAVRLCLYVAGSGGRSLEAVERARRFCDEHLTADHELEVVDIYESPERASEAQIVAVPTLVKESPPPTRRVVGDLSDETRLLSFLDLPTGS